MKHSTLLYQNISIEKVSMKCFQPGQYVDKYLDIECKGHIIINK